MFERSRARSLIDSIDPGSMPACLEVIWEYLVESTDRYGVVIVTPNGTVAMLRSTKEAPSAGQVQDAITWLRGNFLLTKITTAAEDPYANHTYRIILDAPPSPQDPRPADARPRPRRLRRPRPQRLSPRETARLVSGWLAADLKNERLAEDAARWVAGHHSTHACWPNWTETAQNVRPELAGLPHENRQEYIDGLINGLIKRLWLVQARTNPTRVAPGPKLRPHRKPTGPEPVQPRPRILDRGY